MTDALKRLIGALEGGKTPAAASFASAWPSSMHGGLNARRAALGSLDAALSLLAAILPDHEWGRAPQGQMWVRKPGAAFHWSGDGRTPARGLLLAVLRAKLAEISETAEG